jgi:hypothetical protein
MNVEIRLSVGRGREIYDQVLRPEEGHRIYRITGYTGFLSIRLYILSCVSCNPINPVTVGPERADLFREVYVNRLVVVIAGQ